MSKITGAGFDAVKGVFLIGDPMHKAGLPATSTSTAAPRPRASTACPSSSAASPRTGSPRPWMCALL
ncbi:cutinase [Apiospora marii]|uniref:cutinase n=1 Tax=Apiospora marii TaxID=335849 RepID=UPI00312F4E22